MEALDAGKHVIVVINDSLMDNHQTELADQLANEKYLVHTTPKYVCARAHTCHMNTCPFLHCCG